MLDQLVKRVPDALELRRSLAPANRVMPLPSHLEPPVSVPLTRFDADDAGARADVSDRAADLRVWNSSQSG